MIKAVIAVVAVLAAFGAGMFGVYIMMPTIAPEKVEQAQAHLDSLAHVDSLAWAYSQRLPPDTTARQPDSLAVAPAMPVAETPEEAPVEDAAEEVDIAAELARQNALQDSLAAVQRQFEQLMREQKQLLEEVKSLKDQVEEQQIHSDEIEELSGTLAKLEDKELAGVVERLDMGVLEALYERASARNRKRLLQAMPAEAAASFVRRLVRPSNAPVTKAVTPPDTTAAMPASGS